MTHRQLKDVRLLQLADVLALGLQIIPVLLDINSHYVHIPRFSYEIQIKKKKNQAYNLDKKAIPATVAQEI